MLEFADAPHAFYAAKPNRWIQWLGRLVNRRFTLSGPNHRIVDVSLRGAERLDGLRKQRGHRCFFVANHGTHSDPQMMLETQRRLGMWSCFMAAYDVFLRGRRQAWLMQRGGCFSVNRDGSDGKAMREAIRILTETRHGLTVFPEGNVYLMNDRVTPFLDGAAFIGMKAQKVLGKEDPIHVIPVSLKATHLTDTRDALWQQLEGLARDMGTELDREKPFVDEVKRIGLSALERSLQQRGYLPATPDLEQGTVRDHLEDCAEMMVVRLEEKMALRGKPRAGLGERLAAIRVRIHKIRTDSEAKMDHAVAATWADEAMIALRVLSYAGDYLEASPTVDRCGETVEKLLEDIYSEVQRPCGDRQAMVEINEPICLADHLDAFQTSGRETVRSLTSQFEAAVQGGLDRLAQTNTSVGSERF